MLPTDRKTLQHLADTGLTSSNRAWTSTQRRRFIANEWIKVGLVSVGKYKVPGYVITERGLLMLNSVDLEGTF